MGLSDKACHGLPFNSLFMDMDDEFNDAPPWPWPCPSPYSSPSPSLSLSFPLYLPLSFYFSPKTSSDAAAADGTVSVKDRIVRMSNKLGGDNLKKRNNVVKSVPGKLPMQMIQRWALWMACWFVKRCWRRDAVVETLLKGQFRKYHEACASVLRNKRKSRTIPKHFKDNPGFLFGVKIF